MDQEPSEPLKEAPVWRPPMIVGGAALCGVLVWAFWPTLVSMAERWSHDPRYSHGYLVPAFAVFLLWLRRDMVPAEGFQTSWSGLVVLLLGAGLYLLAGRFFFVWLDAAALLPVITGLALFLGGWRALAWAWPALCFLVFMFPLPYRIEVGFADPLQRIATRATTYVLQTVGYSAVHRGNVILVEDMPAIGVKDACSGLSMLITFCSLSAAMAVIIRRPLVDKVIVLVSAVPIALLANIARIVAYVVLYRAAGPFWAEDFFHRRAGWLMMPLALGLLWLELKIVSALLVETEPDELPPIDLLAGVAGSR